VIDLNTTYSNRRGIFANAAKVVLFLLATAVMTFAQTPSLDRVSCVTKTFSSAGTDTCRAFLTTTNSTHVYIALSSNNPAVTVPSGITVSYYAGSKGFTATVASVKTAQTALITATLNGVSKSFAIALSPSTTSGAAMSVNATSLGFGSVVVNSPVAQSVTVTSTGTTALVVNSATVTGTGFSLSGANFPVTLNPGQSFTFEVQFDPLVVASYSGQLSIVSSASTKTIPLSGTGAAHQVQLSWSAPSTSGYSIIGYNVYRALTGSTSFARLNGSIDQVAAYTDSTVKSGTAYDYTVRSVDSAGAESSPSNKTTVKVP